jgi:hypothetical protein
VIDWTDNKKRKALREALQKVYPKPAMLEMFVDEELNEKLADVTKNVNTAYELIQWADREGHLNELFAAFKQENPNHSAMIAEIEQKPLIPQTSNLNQAEWDELFQEFQPDDLADLCRAFYQGFQRTFGNDYRTIRPDYSPLVELDQIRELLESYDGNAQGPILAVRFVECAIEQITRSSDSTGRDLTGLEQWRDRIAQQFQVPPRLPESNSGHAAHAYLLVTLEEMGAGVIAYPELRMDETNQPIEFGVTPVTCTIDKVADHIASWMQKAEARLMEDETWHDSEVILEIFLPCRYLEEEIGTTWLVRDRRGEGISLGMHRRFIVRSSDRLRDRQIQKSLKLAWARLQKCIEQGCACGQFHQQQECPDEKGALRAILKDNEATGLKLLAQLPSDLEKRRDLLNEMIDAAIPIALWTSAIEDVDGSNLEIEFDQILNCSFTNFAELARHWRKRRQDQPVVAKPIKILCDNPNRLPHLPDLTDRADTDAIVAY